MVLTEGFKLTKTLQKIKAIAFLRFWSQVANVFKTTFKVNFRQYNKEFVEFSKSQIIEFSKNSSNVSHTQVSLSDMQVYLSFLDGYAYRIINFTENITQYNICFSSAHLATTKYNKELVMICNLQLFVQSSDAKQLYIFRQTYCLKEIYKLSETEFSKHVIDTEKSLIDTLTSALVRFDWLIELYFSINFSKLNTNEFNKIVKTDIN